jgi:ribosomal protein S18 acetylase RimI-like enzyme
MAAATEVLGPAVVQLPHLRPLDLDPLLAEEIGAWEQQFAWDFRPSADLLRRFLQIRSLSGSALRLDDRVIGYAYSVCENRKGLIGDFYLREQYQRHSFQMMLLEAMVRNLMLTPGVRRIESQLMMLRTEAEASYLPFGEYLRRHDRFFMRIGRAAMLSLKTRQVVPRVRLVAYHERYLEEMAHVVSGSYRGHVDSEINDQYRNIPGSRQFLTNIIRFPGCGRFSAEASVLAIDENTGRVCGMCLASHVSAASGHITQLCILPALRSAGIGYELLRQALHNMLAAGCETVSLTVTCENVDAIRLYESIGFTTITSFPALVWEGF